MGRKTVVAALCLIAACAHATEGPAPPGRAPTAGASRSEPDPAAPVPTCDAIGSARGDGGRRVLERILVDQPRCAAARFELARIHRHEGRLDDAERELHRGLELAPDAAQGLHQLALLQLARADDDIGTLDRAALTCRRAVARHGEHAPILNTWGVVDVQRGRLVEALSKFERAFSSDPSLYEAWTNYGQIALSFRDYAGAARAFGGALATRSDDYDALLGHGVALRGLGRIEEARRRYEQARRVDPSRPEAWYNLGVLFQEHLPRDEASLRRARTCFEAFVARARRTGHFDARIEEVLRCCERPTRDRCEPGRLQDIGDGLRALRGTPPPRCDG